MDPDRPDLRITLTADPAGGWTTIGYLGAYHDDRYGDFELTGEMVASWQRNLANGAVTGQAGMLAIDFDHSSQKGSTRAAGWLREIRLDGEKILGRVEWTPAGKAAIAEGEYRYFSPTFTRAYKDDQGRQLGDTLVGGALTNAPFLRSKGVMAVALSALEVQALEQRVAQLTTNPVRATTAAPAATPDVSDSYRAWALSTGHGGDIDAAGSGRVDRGRQELDALVRREMARAGDDDYSGALDRTLAAGAAGEITLSDQAAAGTGLEQPTPGWRDRADVPVVAPEDDPRFLDSLKFCQSRRQLAAGEENVDAGTGVGRRSEALERRDTALRQLAQARGIDLQALIDQLGEEM